MVKRDFFFSRRTRTRGCFLFHTSDAITQFDDLDVEVKQIVEATVYNKIAGAVESCTCHASSVSILDSPVHWCPLQCLLTSNPFDCCLIEGGNRV